MTYDGPMPEVYEDEEAPHVPIVFKHTGKAAKKTGVAALGRIPLVEAEESAFAKYLKSECYFVAWWGSDSGNDGTYEKPWRTVNTAERMSKVGDGLNKRAVIVLLGPKHAHT